MKRVKKPNRKATQKEIAERAGVSVSTVSMVMREEGNISAEVKTRVLAIADELGYERKTSRNIRKHPIYITLIEYESFDYQWNFIKPYLLNVSQELRKKNIYAIIHHLDTKQPNLDELAMSIKESGSRAVCSIHFFDRSFFMQLQQVLKIPVIILNNSVYQDVFPAVCVDDFQGMYNGTSYLIQKGHRNFLFFDYHRTDLPAIVADRYLGFQKAISEIRIPFSEEKHRTTLHLEEIADMRSIIGKTLRSYPGTSAIVFHDDYLAGWGLAVVEEMGYRIPEDLSVIAPGDTLDFDQPFSPRLTTIRIDTAMMGRMAANLIVQYLNDPTTPVRNLKVIPQIVERGSCRVVDPDKEYPAKR